MSDNAKPGEELDILPLLGGAELKAQITFDELFFLFARFAAARSKDPRTQCGSCIVHDRHVVGIGYNGFTAGMPDYEKIWVTKAKYLFVEHAERNAIHNSDRNKLKGSSIYIWTNRNYPPCPECAKAIVQNRISAVCLPMQRGEEDAKGLNWSATQEMLRCARVEIRWMRVDINGIMRRLQA